MTHFIRLRGPWSYSPVARWVRNAEGNWLLAADALPNGGTVSLPGDWGEVLGKTFAGNVRFTRTFRCPEALATAAHVWLTIEDVGSSAKIELNDQILGEIVGSHADESESGQRCPARFEITRQ